MGISKRWRAVNGALLGSTVALGMMGAGMLQAHADDGSAAAPSATAETAQAPAPTTPAPDAVQSGTTPAAEVPALVAAKAVAPGVALAAPAEPVITGPVTGDVIPGSFAIWGQGEPGAQVTVVDESGATLCTATVSGDGDFSCPDSVRLSVGAHSLSITAENPGGSTARGAAVGITISATLAPVPMFPSPGDWITVTSVFGGVAAPGAAITILDGAGNPICSTMRDSDGTYNCSPATPLPLGDLSYSVSMANGLGGFLKSAPINVTAVQEPILLSPAGGATVGQLPDFTGTARPGAGLQIWNNAGLPVCTTTVASDGSFTCTPTRAFMPGTYYFTPYIHPAGAGNTVSGATGRGMSVTVVAGSAVPSPPAGPSETQSVSPEATQAPAVPSAVVAEAAAPGELANTGFGSSAAPVAGAGMLVAGAALVLALQRRKPVRRTH